MQMDCFPSSPGAVMGLSIWNRPGGSADADAPGLQILFKFKI